MVGHAPLERLTELMFCIMRKVTSKHNGHGSGCKGYLQQGDPFSLSRFCFLQFGHAYFTSDYFTLPPNHLIRIDATRLPIRPKYPIFPPSRSSPPPLGSDLVTPQHEHRRCCPPPRVASSTPTTAVPPNQHAHLALAIDCRRPGPRRAASTARPYLPIFPVESSTASPSSSPLSDPASIRGPYYVCLASKLRPWPSMCRRGIPQSGKVLLNYMLSTKELFPVPKASTIQVRGGSGVHIQRGLEHPSHWLLMTTIAIWIDF
jgi:hypothetical protein